jgi:putative membrane protein
MLVTGLVLAGVAAAIHVYIFYLESIAWTRAPGRRTFGLSEDEAEATRELAFNQGFYNLFLAIMTATGIVLALLDRLVIGATLVIAGLGSMVLAAAVLFTSSPARRGAALKQGVVPLLALLALILGLLL